MEVFGLPFQELIFNFFLPFLLFFVLFYALLEKSKVLGEKPKFNLLVAFSLAGIGVISIYSLRLMPYLTWIIVGTMFIGFFGLFLISSLSFVLRKTEKYYTGEAFLTKEEKEFENAKKSAIELWEKLQDAIKRKDEAEIKKLYPQLDSQIKILEKLAPKVEKNLSIELPWYDVYKAEKGG